MNTPCVIRTYVLLTPKLEWHLTRKQDEVSELSEEHRAYLLQRHGTLDLSPIPDMSDADPYNWSQTKVTIPANHNAYT